MTFWSWCDDSVHSRLFACSPENPSFAHSVAVRLHQFGRGFGVVFCLIWNNIPEDWKLLQRVPIGTSYQQRLTRREKAGMPGAVEKGRKGFYHHHK